MDQHGEGRARRLTLRQFDREFGIIDPDPPGGAALRRAIRQQLARDPLFARMFRLAEQVILAESFGRLAERLAEQIPPPEPVPAETGWRSGAARFWRALRAAGWSVLQGFARL